MTTAEIPRRWAWPGLAAVLVGGLSLRLWGIGQGLPYSYNTDEADHFVPHAAAMSGFHLNPHYFANPPAFTYLLHLLFALSYGGKTGVEHALAVHPGGVYTLARAAAAVLGTAALWLLYATGARLFGRGVGLLAAAIEAVAFLPVFYAHLALNDVPTLAPLTLSLLGSAGVLRKGRTRDYLLAGVGLGLACASKYTAGIVILPFAAAVAARFLDGGAGAGRRALAATALTGAAALLAFLIANPYAVLDYQGFHRELVHQSTLSAEAQGKLGAPRHGGFAYYLWALTWGLGWLPALAAVGGALTVWGVGRTGGQAPARGARQRRGAREPAEGRRPASGDGVRLGWLLVPAPLLFLAFMGLQGRYFGRWLLPIFPILCLLAAFFGLRLANAGARLMGWLRQRFTSRLRRGTADAAGGAPRGLGVGLLVLLVAVLLAQGLYYSVHSGMLLARADTRNLTRRWMLAHVPAGAPIVVEPVAPDAWAREGGPGASRIRGGYRWIKYPSLLSRISHNGALEPSAERLVGIEDYERTLSPVLIGFYANHGYCWVVSGSTQSGRAFADPKVLPLAIAYYRALAEQGEVLYRVSPYARGKGPVEFDFDWSFDYYPLAYHRPGPEMTVYRLHAGRCK
jgi:4-amino-4-deoxy-L-arabinose transferase-like glycosyltransferase